MLNVHALVDLPAIENDGNAHFRFLTMVSTILELDHLFLIS
jgi:hypothetical protein